MEKRHGPVNQFQLISVLMDAFAEVLSQGKSAFCTLTPLTIIKDFLKISLISRIIMLCKKILHLEKKILLTIVY